MIPEILSAPTSVFSSWLYSHMLQLVVRLYRHTQNLFNRFSGFKIGEREKKSEEKQPKAPCVLSVKQPVSQSLEQLLHVVELLLLDDME